MSEPRTPLTEELTEAAATVSLVPRSAVLFIFVTVLLDMIGLGLILPVVPALLADVGATDLGQATVIGGWMFAAYALAQFLFGPVMGSLSDAYGRRPLLLLAIGGLAVDYVFSALAPTLVLIFVGRVIAGLCGASHVIAFAFLTDITTPERRARAFGMVGAALGLGFVIGPAIGGLLGEFGPRVPFWAAAGVSALNLVFGWFVLPETLPPENRRRFDWRRANPFGMFKVFRGYPTVLPLTGVLGLYLFAGAIYPTLWAFWGIAQFGWSEAMIGVTLAAFGILTATTEGLLSGPLVRRLGEHRIVVIGLAIASLGALGFGLATTLTMVLALLVFVAFEGLVHPCLTAVMTKEVPDDAQGELQGGISGLSNLAMLFGTIFFSQIFGWFVRPEAVTPRPGAPFVIAAGLLALALVVYLALRRSGEGADGGGLTQAAPHSTLGPQEAP